MFRRKKSSSSEAEQSRPAISISGPMRITAQAPHASTPAPLYERFARTNVSSTTLGAGLGHSRRPSKSSFEAGAAAVKRPEIRQERVGRGHRPGAIGMLSREDVARVTQQQQVSPPTSPTFPRARATSNANADITDVKARPMPSVDAHALDDPTPPKSLLRERQRPKAEETKLTRMLTPPSPQPLSTPTPPSASSPTPLSPISPMTKQSTTLASNDPEASSRGPRKAKYSPLAAFGPPVSAPALSSQPSSSSSIPPPHDDDEDVPPPPPPKPRISIPINSPPVLNIDSSHIDPRTETLSVEPSRPSNDLAYSERHASVQPLKTASVELRVGLNPDDLETFHSPLFGAAFNTQTKEVTQRSNDRDGRDDDNTVTHAFEPRVQHGSRQQQRGEANTIDRSKNASSSAYSRSRSGLLDSGDDDGHMEGRGNRWDHINVRGRSTRNGRMGTPSILPEKTATTITPPTPPSPPAAAPTMLHDPATPTMNGESEGVRKRSDSTSSAGSMRRRVGIYAKFTDVALPGVPGSHPPQQQEQKQDDHDRSQTPRTPVMRGQMPTPPTSVDEHGNGNRENQQRLTIASVLDGEHSITTSPSPFRRTRKKSTTDRTFFDPAPTGTSSPLADNLANGRLRQGDSHAKFMKNEMNSIVPTASSSSSSMAPSTSTSSADVMPYRVEGTRGMHSVTTTAGSSVGASVSARPTPKLQTQDLPTDLPTFSQSQAHSHPAHLNGGRGDLQQQQQQQQQVPLSPPQSPPQQITPPLSSQSQSSSRSRARSKSRTRSNNNNNNNNRPGTDSSAQSLNYVPPSSASSSDGPGRSSPSAFSVLNSFTSSGPSANGHSHSHHTPRKLVKTPPHSARSTMAMEKEKERERESTAEQYRRTITESPVDMQMDSAGGLVDEDPFAKGEIVRALPPLPPSSSSQAGGEMDPASIGPMTPPVPPFARSRSVSGSGSASASGSVPPSPADSGDYFSSHPHRRGQRLDSAPREAVHALSGLRNGVDGEDTPRPLAVESGAGAKENFGEEAGAEDEAEPEPELEVPTYYPLEKHLMQPELLSGLLPYLAFRDWTSLTAVNDAMRRRMEHTRELRELVLEHYLRTVGYARWRWSTKEHVMLTFRDLNSYMRGVSIPSHQYATQAKAYLDAKQQAQEHPGDEYLKFNLKTATAQKSLLASSCRAYTRVVLRLRAQAEAIERDAEGDEKVYQFTPPQSTTSVSTKQPSSQNPARRSMSRVRAGTPSRPDSPSSMSQSQHGNFMNGSSSSYGNGYTNGYGKVNRYERAGIAGLGPRFRSPLFRVGHAPCLRVCVPSSEGIWLSDASVLECEKELKRSGVLPLMRVGDVVWDAAVGDEGNIGRMVWDGNYLIDLDYTYSRTGEVPQYLHTLSFPPSYFHRVIRTPGNPICHIDVSPWGEEIAANLQLLQDRIKTETPQGGHHTVVRWIHRSKFRIRPNPYTNAPIAIPGTSLSVDPGWYGAIIIEIEGTNEGLADLQQRCRSGFPPRARGAVVAGGGENGHAAGGKPASKVWRLLRERSRPGEIWLRAVREKERLL